MSFIVHLNGLPGTGKKTIAIELAKLFNAKVLDNHTLLNPAAALYEWGSKEFYDTAQTIRDAVLPDVEKTVRNDVPVILTNALHSEVMPHLKIFEDFRNAARNAHAPFFPVLLTCDREENARRIQFPERIALQKPTDPRVLDNTDEDFTLIRPPFSDSLDVTNLSPAEAALAIANMIQERLRKNTGIPHLKIF